MVSNNGHGRDYLAPRKTSAGGASRFASGPGSLHRKHDATPTAKLLRQLSDEKDTPDKGTKTLITDSKRNRTHLVPTLARASGRRSGLRLSSVCRSASPASHHPR